MVDPATVQRIAERTDHVFLAHQLGKTLRTPLAGKDEIGHQATVFHRMFHCAMPVQPPRPRHALRRFLAGVLVKCRVAR